MADNMTIGPALSIGGNTVQMTQKGKVQVTNAQGKVKTLSQDQFKKQLIKNANNIETGKDFEFKKDNNKTALIAGGTIAAAAIATGIVYRKDITKYVKDFSWNKLKKDVKGLFSGAKEKISGLFKKKSKITPKIGVEYENAANLNFAKEFDAKNMPGSAYMQERTKMVNDARAAFSQGVKLEN